MQKGDQKKSWFLLFLLTPLVVLPFVLMGIFIFKKKKILATIAPADITTTKVNTANYIPGTTISTNGPNQVVTETQYKISGNIRESFFSGYKDLTVNVYEDGSIVVWQGPGDFIAGAEVPYWWWVKNVIETWWDYSLFLATQKVGSNSLHVFYWQAQEPSALTIPYAAIVNKTLPDPYGVLK